MTKEDKQDKPKDEGYGEFFKEDAPKPKKRKAKVLSISKGHITVNVNGNGERVPFDAVKHKDLKVGDEIEI